MLFKYMYTRFSDIFGLQNNFKETIYIIMYLFSIKVNYLKKCVLLKILFVLKILMTYNNKSLQHFMYYKNDLFHGA